LYTEDRGRRECVVCEVGVRTIHQGVVAVGRQVAGRWQAGGSMWDRARPAKRLHAKQPIGRRARFLPSPCSWSKFEGGRKEEVNAPISLPHC